ncbi:DUF2341 domain-containing protein [bacterium]|nr:DUF2341 domain-containing protein [bacterium]
MPRRILLGVLLVPLVTACGPGVGMAGLVVFSNIRINYSSTEVTDTVDTGEKALSCAASDVFTLVNPTSSAASALSISGLDSFPGIDISSNCGSSLAAGASCQVTVSYTPTSSGDLSGTLSVSFVNGERTVTKSVTVDATVPAWYPGGWCYRQKITVPHSQVGATLTDFPVLVKTTDTSNALFANAQADGDDILFSLESDATTKLAHEIENYSSSGELEAWVKIPSLSSTTDTVFYMYYGKADATNQQDGTDVWDSGYQGVWHLQQSVTNGVNGLLDSTSNANHGAPANYLSDGTSTTAYSAKIYKGVLQSRTGDEGITVSPAASLAVSYITLEAWARQDDAASNNQRIAERCINSGNCTQHIYQMVVGNGGGASFNIYTQTGSQSGANTGTPPTTGTWHHFVGTFDGTTLALYVDGVVSGTNGSLAGQTIRTASTGLGLGIGRQLERNSRSLGGAIDEVRLSNLARSAEWIAASYANQSSPSTFCVFE